MNALPVLKRRVPGVSDGKGKFGARLKQLREAAGLTVYALAKRAGLAQINIHRIESGERDPAWGTAVKLADALGVSDVICIPSLEDNYPNVIVEGMACGTPSVGYATGGIAEMIDDKLTGVFARPVGSVAALRAALLHFAVSYLNDNDMRARCREADM